MQNYQIVDLALLQHRVVLEKSEKAVNATNVGRVSTKYFIIISQLRCFLTFAGQSFNILIVLRASGLKATSSEA